MKATAFPAGRRCYLPVVHQRRCDSLDSFPGSFLRGAGSARSFFRTAFALASLAVGVLSVLRALRARKFVDHLENVGGTGGESVEDEEPATFPKLSAVVPARNEERHLEEALGSVASQEYPGELEVILVDDRSDDATPEIGRRLAWKHPGLRLISVTELPEGWLGKNHAASVGVSGLDGTGGTSESWLVFCDADIVFEPLAFRKAVARAERESLDHLTLVPRLELDGYLLRSVTAFSWMIGFVHLGVYRANIDGSGTGVGIGAFNLIRRRAYERIGTHERLRLAVVDDLALGRAVKDAGLRQRMFFAQSLARVRWHESFGSFLSGIENTVYAGVGFSPVKAAGYAGAISALFAGPFVGLFLGTLSKTSSTRALYLGAALCHLGSFLLANSHLGREAWRLAPFYPAAAITICGILARSTVAAERRGGLVWRETFYPLELLREAARQADRDRPSTATHQL